MQKVFVGNTHRLKSAKILVVLIKKRDRKCGLTLTEAKIVRKHMQSYENHITQPLMKIQALIIFYIKNAFT